LLNNEATFTDKTTEYGLGDSHGLWCSMLSGDFDNDGDVDMVAGNLGTNTQLHASASEPVTITYGDFYGNGIINPILCYYNKGKSFPYLTKDEMADQIPSIQKKFLKYADYADAQLEDIFTREQLARAKTLKVKMMQSVYLQNEGDRFAIKPLPMQAQISPVNGMVAADVDNDGNKDVILAGNFYPLRVSLGPLDAGIGLVLKGNGKGEFFSRNYQQTGLYLPGDVRNIIDIKGAHKTLVVAAKNNGQVQVVQLN
jgi:hypothetical protein